MEQIKEYANIPQYTLDSLSRYIEHGIEPGGFLCAVLSNDLFSAVAKADSSNRECLVDIVTLIYNQFPLDSYGSQEAITNYINNRKSVLR